MPNRTSLTSNLGIVQMLASAPRTADANSTGLDVRDSDDVLLAFVVGANGDTLSGSTKIECEVQESDDNSTFTPVANADLTYAEAGTNVGTAKVIDANAEANQVYKVGYKGSRRYIRGVVNVTGTHSTGTPVGVLAIKGRNRYSPAA